MFNQNETLTTDDGHKHKLVIKVESKKHKTSSDININPQQQQHQQQQDEPYIVAKGKENRNQKAPVRYDFKNRVSFALLTGTEYPMSYKNTSDMLTKLVVRDKFKHCSDLIHVHSY